MGKILPLNIRTGREAKDVYFDRTELIRLINTYSRQGAGGAWRDYAIDHRPGYAVFSIYRASHETALFSIVKFAKEAQKRAPFMVLQGQQPLKYTASIEEAVSAVEKKAEKVIALFAKS